MKVKDIMTKAVFYLNANRTLSNVEELIECNNIRHVPVVDQQGHVKGIISQRNLLQTAFTNISANDQKELLRGISVLEIMNPNVITTTPDTDLSEAAKILVQNKIGCLPVLDENKKLIGILTETDFVRYAAPFH